MNADPPTTSRRWISRSFTARHGLILGALSDVAETGNITLTTVRTHHETLEYDEQVQFGKKPARWETRIAPVVINGAVEYIAGVSRDVTDIRA